ncbi:hypothetical protein JQ633_18265, partial [Bradyrhizobium tropiciagri]|uniref:SdrD B-like domain-containing protein n=1 Tax=Bradyrhizobium tropiciagri TaxID=312253 RepID=UPI001BA45BD0
LDPGKYIVEEVLSGGYVTKDNVDVAITLASGETHGVDEGTTFMNYKLASVNGIKLLDANADGLKQAGENTPISGITINLYKDLNGDGTLQADERDGVIDGDAQDTPFKTTATAADGTWSFTGLDPGKYIVEEVLSGGYVTKDNVDVAITLASGETHGVDEGTTFMNYKTASVNGIKLLDANADGLKQAGENTPISGITINLYKDLNGDGTLQPDERDGVIDGDAQDTPFKTTSTAADGTWSFTGLDPGKYIVEEVLSGGYVTKDNVDVAITLASGETHGVDEGTTFMNYKTASVNGIKLLDLDADGVHDAGENTPISGITINLYKDLNGDGTLQADERDGVIDGDAQDTPFKTTATAADGTWSFSGLDPGKYIVEEVLSGGYVTNDNVDVAITLASGETHGVDEGTTFMNYKAASVNGIKLLDADADGVKDAGENTPISGITINLYKDLNGDGTLQADERDGVIDGDAQDTPFKTTATAADGTWSFNGLDPGKYIVEEVLSGGYVTKDNVDVAITLASGETHGVDEGTTFMNYKTASVNGIKLLDADADGVKDAGENTPISGITINLYKDLNGDGTLQADERDGVIDGDAQDTPFKTTATAADGTWSFSGLDPGKYIVEEVLSNGYVTKDNVDVAITLASGETHGVDEGTTFMNYKTASVNGIKLLDADADGVHDAGENTPISGITINLYKDLNGDGVLQPDERDGVIDGDAQDTPFKTTATAADGTWSFSGLDPGKYIVEEVLSGGYVTKDNVDVAITLASGETHGVDEGTTFMNYKAASVNGIKLLDANADGLKQAGENTPISGITINLYKDLNGDGTLQADERDGVIDGDSQDTPFKTTATAADGTWSFTGLDPGKYIVEEVLSGGYVTKDNVDVAITLASGETHGVDEGTTFMNYKTASVNGIKLLDANADGLKQAGENTPISGITINLYKDLNGDGTLQADERDGIIDGDSQDSPFKTTATAADGTWSFSGLDPGKYIVEEVLSNGYVTKDNVDVAITLASGETHGVDEGTTFMNYKPASVNGIKLLDANANGLKDATENTPISGITINLYKDLNGDGVLQADERDGIIDGDSQDAPFKTTSTAADGTWSFSNLDPGKYVVEEVLSNGYVTKDNVDVAITLASGETHGVDEGTTFMNYKPASVNGIKLLDLDADGIKDANENTPVSGITINLYKDLNGDGVLQADERDGVIDGDSQDSPFKTTTTAADGTWSFSGLDPGKYLVQEVLSGGYQSSDKTTIALTLASGESHGVDADTTFMNYVNGSIHGLKFNDLDADGKLDGADSPMAGITIQLKGDVDGNGTIDTQTTTTDANGHFSFENLHPGTYTISELFTDGTNWGATVDHNNDGIGDATTTVTVLSGQEVVAVAGEAGQLDSLHTEVNVGDALTFGNHQLGALGLTPGFWYNHEYVWDAPISGSDTSNGKADGKGVSLASKLAAAGTITAPDIANLLPNNPLAGGTSDVDGDNHKDLFFQGADGNLVIQWDDAQETVGAANGTGGDKLGDFVRYAVTTALNEVGVPNFNAPNGLLGDIADWLIKYGGVTKIDTNNDGTTDTFVLKYNNKHETDNPGNGQDGNVPKAKDGVSGFGYSTSVKASSAAWQTGDPAHGVPSGSQIFADMNATTDGATGSNMLVSMNQSMVLMANDNGDYFGVLGVAPNTHDGYLHLT